MPAQGSPRGGRGIEYPAAHRSSASTCGTGDGDEPETAFATRRQRIRKVKRMELKERVEAKVDEILATEPGQRYKKIWDLHISAAANDEPSFAIRVAGALRSRSQFALSEYVLSMSLQIPGQRNVALFELSVTAAMNGDPAAALRHISVLREAAPLNPYQLRHAAIQHALLGEVKAAHALVSQIADLDPAWQREALITWQFVNYLERYPKQAALEMYKGLKDNFKFAHTPQVETAISEAIKAKRPFLMLRTGDGEGTFTRVSLQDEAEFNILYQENRREFINIWFKDNAHLEAPGFEVALRGYEKALKLADYWAGFHVDGINHEYRIASRRGIPALVNMIRKANLRPAAPSVTLCDPTIHYFLLMSGAFDRMLRGLPEVSLISCHDELPERLAQHYSISTVNFHKVPGERGRQAILGQAAVRGVHFPDRFTEICAELRKCVTSGQIFLVAAGLLGKVYCAIIKEHGGIAIDIGSVADIWMGLATRSFPEKTAGMRLPPTAKELANAAAE
jgi:tetratricopeptide (TPR) repeat protein